MLCTKLRKYVPARFLWRAHEVIEWARRIAAHAQVSKWHSAND
jgi:hypothetical protein